IGTGNATVNNGGTLGLRGNITVANALSINGPGAAGRFGALEATFATTIPDANPVYAGNITLAGSATIGMAPDSIAGSFTITVNLAGTTLSMTGSGFFNGLREGWVRTQQDYTTPNPNNGINGGVVTNIRMASVTARTGGTAACVDNPGPNNNFAWSDNTTFI